ncbi:MAG: nucleotidyl transferase AbiEii/AbiGii toxin family protein [Armatimonadetes bacterium]|nr:nucleotidyl transferase AbiEii/AbiGii toxin family protein [Armatimonadota bacterium]
MKEPLPLTVIHEAVLDFIRGRRDAVLFGAHAVNAYVGEPRATQDVDLMSPGAAKLADELRAHLARRFQVALRVRQAAQGQGLRIYQVRQEGNRHLVDLRQVETLPPTCDLQGILVLDPPSLIASKVVAIHRRQGRPKSLTDSRDLAMLLLTFPELKDETGRVAERLAGEDAEVRALWLEWTRREILPEEDDY